MVTITRIFPHLCFPNVRVRTWKLFIRDNTNLQTRQTSYRSVRRSLNKLRLYYLMKKRSLKKLPESEDHESAKSLSRVRQGCFRIFRIIGYDNPDQKSIETGAHHSSCNEETNGRSLIRIQGNPLRKRTLRGNPLSTHREHQVEDEENVLDEVHPAGLHAACFRRIDLLSSNCQSRYLNPISRRHFAGFARPIAGSALCAAVVRSVRERSSWCGSFMRRKGLRSKSST